MKKFGIYETASYLERLLPGRISGAILQKSWRMLQRVKLLRNVVTGSPKGPAVQIGPVSICNFSCFFCHTHSNRIPQGEFSDRRNEAYYSKLFRDRTGLMMPMEMFRDLIDDLEKIGVRDIDLSGIGEPLLHPRIVEMVQYAADHAMHCNITTNGALLNEKLCERLLQAGLCSLTISLNSLDPAIYMTTHGISSEATLRNVLAAVSVLLNKKRSRPGFRLNASFAISRLNLQELESAASFFSSHGFNTVYYRPYIALKHAPEFVLSNEEAAGAALKLKELVGTDSDFYALWEQAHRTRTITLPCYVGYLFTFVNSNGDVFPCCGCKAVLGNLKTQRFNEIWKSDGYRLFRKNALQFYRAGSVPTACDCASCPEPVMQKRRLGLIGAMTERMIHIFDRERQQIVIP